MYLIKTNQPVNGGKFNSKSRIDDVSIYVFKSAKEFKTLNPDLKDFEKIKSLEKTVPENQNLFYKPDLAALEELNKHILENSQVSEFTKIEMVNLPTFEVSFLEYAYNGNKGSLKPVTKFIQVGTFQISVSITQEEIQKCNKLYGVNLLDMVKNVLVNEASNSLAKHFASSVGQLARQNYINEYTRWEKFKVWLYKIFKKEYRKKIKVKNSKDLLAKIIMESNIIAAKGKYGYENFAICNLKTAAALEASSQYMIAVENKPFMGQIYPIGTIAGIIIYVDPNMLFTDTNVYIGRKIIENEPGIKFYFKDSEISIVTEGMGAPKMILRMRYAMPIVGENAHYQYRKIEYKDYPKKILL